MLLAFAVACRAPEPAPKSYTLTGQILAVHPGKQSLTIKHQDIPGYMPGMTMTFAAREAAMVAGREPGELVTATLEVGDTWSRLTGVTVTGKAPLAALPAELALAEGILEQGDPLPDATFVDQNGRARTLSEWRGTPVAITFIYTRCPLPEFCPRIDRQFAAVQTAIASDHALAGNATLLTISFDPAYDTPAVLLKHAKALRADPGTWTFVTGAREEIELFAARFGVAVTRTGETPDDVMHNLRTIVAGGDGRIRALYSGSDWTPAQIVDRLRAALGDSVPNVNGKWSMGKLNRRILLALTFSVAVACSGTPTVPVVTTTTIIGTVTTSAPTFAPLAGVTLTVVDGPAAGTSITTTENGEFAFSTVKGPLTVQASKDGYEGQTLTVDQTSPQSLRFTLKPVLAQVTETFTTEMGVACSDDARCRLFALPIHNDGKVSAAAVSMGLLAPINISLWRGDTRIETFNMGHTGSSNFLPVSVTGGEVYHLRVGTSQPTSNFRASVLRPN